MNQTVKFIKIILIVVFYMINLLETNCISFIIKSHPVCLYHGIVYAILKSLKVYENISVRW